MNVAVIGSGGREHALAYKIKESSQLENLFIIPGNPGTENLGTNVEINPSDKSEVLNFCKTNKIELVVIGPEKPLVEGLGNYLRENGFFVFGPDKEAADIEAYKSFAKKLMKKYNIPTADYVEFNSSQIAQAKKYLEKVSFPVVLKADGLAAGKGVLICNNFDEAILALEDMFIKKIFGSSGEKVVIEEFLSGEEASIFAITDGDDFITLPSAQDHKRIGDNDTGKNTGGMGAYSPAPVVDDEILQEVKEKIIVPALTGMKKENKKFNGCLYCGLIITKNGVKVIEFNCRFGDPETQAVLPLLDGDFLQLLYSAASGKIDKNSVKYSGGASVCVVAASKGYPDNYETGFSISGLENINNNIIVFHAGTKRKNNNIVTAGGRVLGVTSIIRNNDLRLAKQISYKGLSKINFNGIYYRKDIADKAFVHL